MPPKTVDLKTLIGKRDNAVLTLKELFEEFEEIYSVELQLERLESTFKIIEAKYRNIKKQQELIADKIIEDGVSEAEQLISANQKVGESIKNEYLKVAKTFAAYQKHLSQPISPTVNPNSLEAMTSAVIKIAEAMQGPKSVANGLERLPVPNWDGSPYPTWKKEFNHWMNNTLKIRMNNYSVLEKPCQKGLGGQTKLIPASPLIMCGKYLMLSLLTNER